MTKLGYPAVFFCLKPRWGNDRDIFLFSVNQFVFYNPTGICQIKEICDKEFDGIGSKTYYLLKPVHNPLSEIYVPLDNEILTGKMRGIMVRDEVYRLIDSLDDVQDGWIADSRLRSKTFDQIIKNGNSRELAEMLNTIVAYQQERIAAGKQLQQADQHSLDKAERLLYQELAFILEITPEEVPGFIRDRHRVVCSSLG